MSNTTSDPASTQDILSKFKSAAPKQQSKSFHQLTKMHVYLVKDAEFKKTQYGDRIILHLEDFKSGVPCDCWGPSNYEQVCEAEGISYAEQHYMLYRGYTNKKRDGKEYKYYDYAVTKSIM